MRERRSPSWAIRSSRSCGGSRAAASAQRVNSLRARASAALGAGKANKAAHHDKAGRLAGRPLGHRDEVLVAGAEQRALQRTRQRQAVLRRGQHVEQGHQILRLRRLHQHGVFDRAVRDVGELQRPRRPVQRSAPPRQHEDVAQRQPASAGDVENSGGDAGGFALAAQLFGRRHPGHGEAVAPHPFGRYSTLLRRRALDSRQGERRIVSTGLHFGGVHPKPGELAGRLRCPEHRVDRCHHGRRAAPGVVASERPAGQRLDDEVGRGAEDARFGAAKPVEALLRIADDEDRRRLLAAGPAARTGIACEPALDGMPLQRARVLELVDQQMLDAAVEPLLHPAGKVAVAQQGECAAFEVGHVGQASGSLV